MISAPIRICIVDDDALFRESLAVALSLQKDFQVVGHYEGVADVRPLLSKAAPDILLLETLLQAVKMSHHLPHRFLIGPAMGVILQINFKEPFSFEI